MSSEDRERLARIIGEFASRVIDLPAENRDDYIGEAVRRIRDLYRDRYRTDAEALVEAAEFSDRLERWIRQTLEILEAEDPGEIPSSA
jgi:hypothetical protein